ncbi:hypothetical protein [Aquimarina brevivitae]|uniref:Uncharacterized protein n=1 Tax=Aquimarina brevivitae TaxID=323412 RepID=A0A4V2F7L5_9FLAO|nr:hypothetical protein [Aquimarina brevivitae]RZT00240.1 hypothetical protein EV197_1476 [Aquimarina brevivitae]
MKNTKAIAIIFMLLIIGSCKNEPYKSNLKLTEHLPDFTSKMTENDTIKIFAVLNMEWWVRRDELIVTKRNNEIRLQTIIKEDTTFQMKNEMRTNVLPEITISNSNHTFEQHFLNKIERTKDKKLRQYIYKIISPNDTLIFYTDGLSDKGGEVREYYKFMNQYYPAEKEFRFPEVKIEEVDDFTF